jgi:hypothetical protein
MEPRQLRQNQFRSGKQNITATNLQNKRYTIFCDFQVPADIIGILLPCALMAHRAFQARLAPSIPAVLITTIGTPRVTTGLQYCTVYPVCTWCIIIATSRMVLTNA